MSGRKVSVVACSLLVLCVLSQSPSFDQEPPPLSEREFTKPDLLISTAVVRLDEVTGQLSNAGAWSDFIGQAGEVGAFIDPRSGTPASIVTRKPLIPGSGKGNTVTLDDVRRELGMPDAQVTTGVVGELVRRYVVNNQGVFAISTSQLGAVEAAQVTEHLWQVSIPQVVEGVPVRDARLLGTLNHGNLVVIGTERCPLCQHA